MWIVLHNVYVKMGGIFNLLVVCLRLPIFYYHKTCNLIPATNCSKPLLIGYMAVNWRVNNLSKLTDRVPIQIPLFAKSTYKLGFFVNGWIYIKPLNMAIGIEKGCWYAVIVYLVKLYKKPLLLKSVQNLSISVNDWISVNPLNTAIEWYLYPLNTG